MSDTSDQAQSPATEFTVNGTAVVVEGDPGRSLLDVLREDVGVTSVKDGCSPQGQCGCCTVLVDGQPRVACVTPARRVRGRSVVTVEGLDDERRSQWADAFYDAGASQCGFCTPGIILRLEGMTQAKPELTTESINQALLAHMCRCTGWQTIHEACQLFGGLTDGETPVEVATSSSERDQALAAERATLEGHVRQRVGAHIALGQGGFAADTAPADSMVAVMDAEGSWVVGESLSEARLAAGKVQGRRTTAAHSWPLEVPEGDWDTTMRTTWVDGAYLETDAAWCEPGGSPSSTVANGGAFGAKQDSPDHAGLDVGNVAKRLADEHERPVLAVASREDAARLSPKRPPIAAGLTSDGAGVIRVVRTPGIVEALAAGLGEFGSSVTIDEVDVAGAPTSALVRSAGFAEGVVLRAGVIGSVGSVPAPNGSEAEADVVLATPETPGAINVSVRCGRVLDAVVLRSYCIGAAHMAWSWLTSEALVVDAEGVVHDLTVRSFGVLRAVDMPKVTVELHPSDGEPVNGSDAVFAAVAAAGWLALDRSRDWPITGDAG